MKEIWIIGLILVLGCSTPKPDVFKSKYSGTLELTEHVLGAKVAGRLSTMTVKEGDMVKASQMIATLDRYEQTKKDHERTAELFKSGGVDAQALEYAQLAMEDQEVVSPIDGIVLIKTAEIGEILPQAAGIIVIGDLQDQWVKVFLTEDVIGQIHMGQKASIKFDGLDQSYEGQVSFIATKAEFTPRNVQSPEDRITQVFAVKVALDHPDEHIHPGVAADVEFKTMSDVAIQVDQLTRRFGKYLAVDGISFSLPYGSIFGFLGANGGGKSTTIRMLCGILAPTSGSGQVAGFDINTQPEQIKTVIGYVSQRFSLYSDLTVFENLSFFGQIYGLEHEHLKNRIEEVLKLSGLEEYRDRLAGELSGGWKQKLAIANGILHKPRILFLDEPTAGIDPLSRRAIWDLLFQLAKDGTALFITTHYMEEAERCNTIAFISRGHILKMGAPSEFKSIAPSLEEAFEKLEAQGVSVAQH